MGCQNSQKVQLPRYGRLPRTRLLGDTIHCSTTLDLPRTITPSSRTRSDSKLQLHRDRLSQRSNPCPLPQNPSLLHRRNMGFRVSNRLVDSPPSSISPATPRILSRSRTCGSIYTFTLKHSDDFHKPHTSSQYYKPDSSKSHPNNLRHLHGPQPAPLQATLGPLRPRFPHPLRTLSPPRALDGLVDFALS